MRNPVVAVVVMGLALASAARAQSEAICGNGVVEVPEQCDDGNTESGDCCAATCVDENLPPDCSGAVASVGQLWPPNHSMAAVGVTGVTDSDGDLPVVTVTAIAQDEPLDAAGDGATCPDGIGVGLDTVRLRAERSGQGDGRFYHVAFRAVDRCDAFCDGAVSVVVRHDNSPKKTPVDGGPLYDSTAGTPPCTGDACDPVDCVPDPDDVDGCDATTMPPAVATRLDRARALLSRRGAKAGRAAARQLARAGRRAARAADRGALSGACAAALTTVLDGAEACARCRAE